MNLASEHQRVNALMMDGSSRLSLSPVAIKRLEVIVGWTWAEGRATKAMVLVVLRAVEQGVRLTTLRRWSVDVVRGVEEGTSRALSKTEGAVERPLRRRADHAHAVGAADWDRERTLRVDDVDGWHRGVRRVACRIHAGLGEAVANNAVMLLDFGLDATTVRRMTDGWQDRANIVEHDALGLIVGEVHGSLHDIVGKGIAEELLKLGLGVDLRDEQTLGLWACAANAFLDDV